ncbi:MAG: hypothetical protein Q7R98_02720 [Candidatus Jorgensenbacteria bacterium]|nr:hypothetical protein [Candidatus Jorgensenbacteria bacterium]
MVRIKKIKIGKIESSTKFPTLILVGGLLIISGFCAADTLQIPWPAFGMIVGFFFILAGILKATH